MTIYFKYFLFTIVMATIPTASQISTSADEENITDTDLSVENTEDELQADTSTWSPADQKKLQHMTEFHQEYQCIFGEGASILDYHEKKNIPNEPPYAQVHM